MSKNSQIISSVITYACLGAAVLGSIMLPKELAISSLSAAPQGSSIYLTGVVRDFDPASPDFGSLPADGIGQYTGIISNTLGEDGKPVYRGSAYEVLTAATNAAGTPIAPTLSNAAIAAGDFVIVDGQIIVTKEFNAGFIVLGVDIANFPLTLLARAGTDTYEPFGSYADPSNGNSGKGKGNGGNINDNKNPRTFTYPLMYPAGTAITVSGQAWEPGKGNSPNQLIEADSGVNSQQVKVLRNGDPVPDIAPAPGQVSLAVYISDYVDSATNTISLLENQVIYLFELYTTDLTSPYADFQDMIILLSLGGTEVTKITPCSPIDDVDAVLDTTVSTGGVASLESFQTWFNDTLGVNMSQQFKIKLNKQANNTFLFDDTMDPGFVQKGGFYPVDGQGYGNEDNGVHNQFFTFQFDASFTYDSLQSQFFSFTSTMDVWVFVNGELVIDLGGIHNSLGQEIDMDRLCLTDGDQVNISLFFAQRNVLTPHFNLSTNVALMGSARPIAALAFYD